MNYHAIKPCDMVNGSDLGVALFVSGCEHHCPGCHNPQTHSLTSGSPFDNNAKQELFNILSQDWCHRLTITGGDPLHPFNREPVLHLLQEVMSIFPNMKIWIYTGYVYEEIKNLPDIAPILDLADVLIDGPFIQAKKEYGLKWRGSSNQRVIDLKTGTLLCD